MTEAKTTRAERLATPLARDSIRKIAESVGGCLRPVQLRRTDTVTALTEQIMIPCGATLASICPPCAERAKMLRVVQCRAGWHLEDEPDPGPPAPDQMQEYWLTLRAEAQIQRDRAEARGEDVTVYDALIGELDVEITRAGVRGTVTSSTASQGGKPKRRRVRSTRRRQDAADLPRRKITPRTIGKVFTAPSGKSYRPSMFLTLTCDSYGKVNGDGTPLDPSTYDYQRAARDALHFSALTDRFIQNLRRVFGYDAQYFGAVEPQKRRAPHLHMAIRGAVPRAAERTVMIPDIAMPAVRRLAELGEPGRERSGGRLHGRLINGDRGGYLGYATWRKYLSLAQGYTAAHPDGIVSYTAHELRHVCASLLIASGASDMQVAHQMGTAGLRRPRTSTVTCSRRTAPPSWML